MGGRYLCERCKLVADIAYNERAVSFAKSEVKKMRKHLATLDKKSKHA
jgi:hypothetical protein